ncbi:MAG: rhodanese-like domain-containing protein [Brevinema sp.]
MDIYIIIAIVVILTLVSLRKRIKISQFKKLPRGEYTLIDVRTAEETKHGMLDTAINIPLGELPKKKEWISKGKPVYVYCATGTRSTMAVQILKQEGFSVQNLGSYRSLKGAI